MRGLLRARPCQSVPAPCRAATDASQPATTVRSRRGPEERQDQQVGTGGAVTDIGEAEAAEVLAWLPRNQFELRSRVGGEGEAFGDEQSIWSRGPARVRVTRDRGQWWCDVGWSPLAVWLDIHNVAGAMHTKLYSTADRLAWVTSSLRRETLRGPRRNSPEGAQLVPPTESAPDASTKHTQLPRCARTVTPPLLGCVHRVTG